MSRRINSRHSTYSFNSRPDTEAELAVKHAEALRQEAELRERFAALHGVTSASRNRRGTGDLRLADSEAPNALGPSTDSTSVPSEPRRRRSPLPSAGIHKAPSGG